MVKSLIYILMHFIDYDLWEYFKLLGQQWKNSNQIKEEEIQQPNKNSTILTSSQFIMDHDWANGMRS